MAYICKMQLMFIETPIFTKELVALITDESYRRLQKELLFRPEAGTPIKGSGGLRKIRWNLPGKGKSGGIRLIYYYDKPSVIYMLFPYKKSAQENLTPSQLKYLTAIIKEYLL